MVLTWQFVIPKDVWHIGVSTMSPAAPSPQLTLGTNLTATLLRHVQVCVFNGNCTHVACLIGSFSDVLFFLATAVFFLFNFLTCLALIVLSD